MSKPFNTIRHTEKIKKTDRKVKSIAFFFILMALISGFIGIGAAIYSGDMSHSQQKISNKYLSESAIEEQNHSMDRVEALLKPVSGILLKKETLWVMCIFFLITGIGCYIKLKWALRLGFACSLFLGCLFSFLFYVGIQAQQQESMILGAGFALSSFVAAISLWKAVGVYSISIPQSDDQLKENEKHDQQIE